MGSNSTVLHTLAYAAVFQQSLTSDQVWMFLHSQHPVTKHTVNNMLLSPHIVKERDRYCLKGEERSFLTRERRYISERKLKKISPLIILLSTIPSIQFIGITGALAMYHSQEDDDVDLFIITSKNSIWVTRFLMVVVLQLLGKRRKRNMTNANNMVCLNMFVDENGIVIDKKRRDIYTAREIVQMLPMFERNRMYERFLLENKWVKTFVANAYITRQKEKVPFSKRTSFFDKVCIFLCRIGEGFAKSVQIWYMKEHITKETITKNMLAFHPFDYRSDVMKKYRRKLKHYDL